jgi:hypothetical protein
LAKKKKASVKRTTKLVLGDKVWIEDGEDSGEYQVRTIDVTEDDCWLYAELPPSEHESDPDCPDCTRDVEQQFPLTWVEMMFESQNPEEWERRDERRVTKRERLDG